MPDGGTFIVTELPVAQPGAVTPARFEWDAAHRSSPRGPWISALKQRTAREEYGDGVTEQVLGPSLDAFTLEGIWEDRWNTPDFAWQTYQDFRAMVARGNLVRFQFEGLSAEGIISQFQRTYHRRERIGYSFTVSPHTEAGEQSFAPLVIAKTPVEHEAAIAALIAEADALHAAMPTVYLVGTTYENIAGAIGDWKDRGETIHGIVENRVLALDPLEHGSKSVARLAHEIRSLQQSAIDFLPTLASASSATDVTFQAAMPMLGYEVWRRGVARHARALIILTEEAAQDLGQSAADDAQALYRPLHGESLYAVSNRFFGGPDQWRAIMARNGLHSFTLTGTELLIIPRAA